VQPCSCVRRLALYGHSAVTHIIRTWYRLTRQVTTTQKGRNVSCSAENAIPLLRTLFRSNVQDFVICVMGHTIRCTGCSRCTLSRCSICFNDDKPVNPSFMWHNTQQMAVLVTITMPAWYCAWQACNLQVDCRKGSKCMSRCWWEYHNTNAAGTVRLLIGRSSVSAEQQQQTPWVLRYHAHACITGLQKQRTGCLTHILSPKIQMYVIKSQQQSSSAASHHRPTHAVVKQMKDLHAFMRQRHACRLTAL